MTYQHLGDGVERQPLHRRVWFQRVVGWGLLLALWEFTAHQVGPFYLPSVEGTARGLWLVAMDGSLLGIAQSFAHMFAGFGIAVVVGVPLGLLMGMSRIAEWVLSPYVKALFVTSLAALLPFVILLFGTGFAFRAAVVFLFSIFYVVITPANGVREIDRGLVEITESLGASRAKTFVSLLLPGSLPFIITGLRLGLGQAIQGVVIAEIWVTVGTGRKLVNLGLARELGEFFALAGAVVIVGASLTQLLVWAQRRFTPWAGDVEASLKGGR